MSKQKWSNKEFLEAFVKFDEGNKSRHSNCYICRFDGVDFFMQQDAQNSSNINIVAIRYHNHNLVLWDHVAKRKFTSRLKGSGFLEDDTRKHFLHLNRIGSEVPDITKSEIVEVVNENYLIRFDNDFYLIFWYPQPGKLTKDQFRSHILSYDQTSYRDAAKKAIKLDRPHVHIADAVKSLIPERPSFYVNGIWLTEEEFDFETPCLTEEEQTILYEGQPMPQMFGITNDPLVREAASLNPERVIGDKAKSLDELEDEPEELFLRVHYHDQLTAYLQAKVRYKEIGNKNKQLKCKGLIGESLTRSWTTAGMEPERVVKSVIKPAQNRWMDDNFVFEREFIRGTWNYDRALPKHDGSGTIEMKLENWHEVTSAKGTRAYFTRR